MTRARAARVIALFARRVGLTECNTSYVTGITERRLHEIGHAFCLWGPEHRWPKPSRRATLDFLAQRISLDLHKRSETHAEADHLDEFAIIVAVARTMSPLGFRDGAADRQGLMWLQQGGEAPVFDAWLSQPPPRALAIEDFFKRAVLN